jgi:hypothetical protein
MKKCSKPRAAVNAYFAGTRDLQLNALYKRYHDNDVYSCNKRGTLVTRIYREHIPVLNESSFIHILLHYMTRPCHATQSATSAYDR